MTRRPAETYPFSAIVGQQTLKSALLINAVDPRVGGVLIRGHKGTAKSTAVRALGVVLPEIDVVDGCRYSCDPAEPGSWCEECRERRESGPLPKARRRPRVVDLPVSATEDRLVGTLHLEHALKHGERVFEPGLLADANRGILYVDEVNLLDDHLVDTLLDAAAMGVNTVEREGVSFVHPARFILVGTMNPEEGEVRPQLLDRFGLCVDVQGITEPAQRVEIVKRRHAFESDPGAFARSWADAEAGLELSLKHARVRLPSAPPCDEVLGLIAEICSRLGVDGHRADLTMARAAAAAAALDGRSEATVADVREVAPLVLAHRMRRTPFEDASYDSETVESLISAASPEGEDGTPPPARPDDGAPSAGEGATVFSIASVEEAVAGPEPVSARLAAPLDRTRRSHSGRRQETTSDDGRGRYVRAEQPKAGAPVDLALDATIRAAAPHQAEREGDMAIKVEPQDVRTKVRKRRVGASIVFCVDASGSMGAASRMETAKAAVLELLVEAYQRRDRVGVVSFRGECAEVLLPPTSSVELAQLKLRSMPTGGATPLAHGIVSSLELLEGEVRRNADTVPWLVLVTDGRANVGLAGGLGSEDARLAASRVRASSVHALVIDTDSSVLGAARELARAAGAEYVRLGRLDGAAVAGAVRERLEAV